jgi:hypothetical protein
MLLQLTQTETLQKFTSTQIDTDMIQTTFYPYWTFAADAFGRTLFNKADSYVVTPKNLKRGDMNSYRPEQGYGVQYIHLGATIPMLEAGMGSAIHPETLMRSFRKTFDRAWFHAASMEASNGEPHCVHTWVDGENLEVGVFRLYPSKESAEFAQKSTTDSGDFILDVSQFEHLKTISA